MKRLATILLALYVSPVMAQPGKPPAEKPPTAEKPPPADKPALPPKLKPKVPKAPKAAPADPYADPAPADPYAAPLPKAPKKPGAPADPYADPAKPDPRKPSAKPPDPIDPYAPPAIPSRVGIADLASVQGLLAVQRLDGWLLFDRDGANPVGKRIVGPDGNPSRPWFYMIPAKGQPVGLVHDAEKRSFDHLPGNKLTYTGYRDLEKQLKAILKGLRVVAVEYSPKAAVPAVSRVDAGTLEMIRAAGVQVKSSDTLVQYTKAIWGDPGRTAHYIAAHHLVELRKEALAYVAKQLTAGAPVTEHDVQQRIVRSMAIRGLAGSPPVVAAGVNTADPYYVPTAQKTSPIRRGDLIVISLAAKVDKTEGIYAAQTWVAVADSFVRDDYKKAFETASLAREHAIALISDRARKSRPITGAEVDQATRAFIKKAGLGERVMHRTGHSIDNDLQGGGADLDDYEVRDTRILTTGTGFTVGPGIYFPGGFGVRSEVSVYFSPGGPEITTRAQDDIEVLLR